jgi:hypothetical protein
VPLPIVANHYLVTQHLIMPAQRHEFINRLCMFTDTGTASQLATHVAASYAAGMTHWSDQVTLGSTDVLPLDGITSTTSFVTASFGHAGGHNTGDALPNSSAFVWSLQTGERGRERRGRMYIPGVRADELVDIRENTLTPAFLANLQADANAFLAAITVAGPPAYALAVLSRRGGFATAVDNIRANINVGVQRRRYERVARH